MTPGRNNADSADVPRPADRRVHAPEDGAGLEVLPLQLPLDGPVRPFTHIPLPLDDELPELTSKPYACRSLSNEEVNVIQERVQERVTSEMGVEVR